MISSSLGMYYDSMTLKLINKRNLILGLTQENSIQNDLPYIPKVHSLCPTILAYSK